jgi:hypothetical protein
MGETMDYLTKEAIMETSLPEDDVEVPTWGGKVHVRALTSAELSRARRETLVNGEMDAILANAAIVVAGCLTPKFPPGYGKILASRKTPGPISKISTRILELSGSIEPEDGTLGEG